MAEKLTKYILLSQDTSYAWPLVRYQLELNIFTQPLYHEQDVTESLYVSGVNQFWIERFPFSQLGALLYLKSCVFPNIYS